MGVFNFAFEYFVWNTSKEEIGNTFVCSKTLPDKIPEKI